MTKQYIGDGVYVEIANGMLKLTTDRVAGSAYTDGPDTIFLEKSVWQALQKYAHAMEIEAFVQNRKGTLNDEPI